MTTRKSSVTGYFYPKDPVELKRMLSSYINNAPDVKVPGRLMGLVEPHAGYIYSGSVAAAGYKLLKQHEKKRIILLGPSHYLPFIGAAVSVDDYWETPLGKVKVEKISSNFFLEMPQSHSKEHALEVQLPFLQLVLKDFSIIPIVIGDVDPQELARELTKLIDAKTLVIASSDLSHYYHYEIAKRLDEEANQSIPKLDVKTVETKVEACGKLGVLTLMHLAKKMKWFGKKLAYANSGDAVGDKTQVVGYGCYAFFEK
jgi:AmmeMemoRadiSam system protein B